MLIHIKGILGEFKKQWVRFLGCEIIFKIFSLAILGPVIAWIVFQLIALSGHAAISNVDIASFILSPLGWVTVVVFAGMGWAITLLGQSGLILIQIGHLNGHPQPVLQATLSTLRRSLPVFQLAIFFVAIFLVLAIPFLVLAFATYRWLLSDSDINYYLQEQPPEFWLALFLGGILVVGFSIVGSFFYARTLFALPECILNLRPPMAALKRSYELTRNHAWLIFRCLVIWMLISSLVFAIAMVAVQGIELLALQAAGESFTTLAIVIGLLLTLNFVVTTAATIFGSITLALLIGGLYWKLGINSLSLDDPSSKLVQHEFPGIVSAKSNPDPERATPATRLTFRRVIFPTLVLVSLTSFGFCWLLLSNVKFEDDLKVTAHRGSSKEAPENTLSAVRQAIEDGADYAEINVQETSDGIIVVMHDADFMRIAGQKQNIWDTTYAELSEIDAGRWFHESFAGERVPTLKQTIDLARGKIKLNIELKFNGHDQQLVARTMDVVLQNDFVSNCVVSSLNHESLLKVSDIAPAIKTGAIVGAAIGDLSQLNSNFIAISVGQVDRELIRRLHRQGKEVHVWTVNDITTMSDMIDLDVDNILTDEPKKLIRLLSRTSKFKR